MSRYVQANLFGDDQGLARASDPPGSHEAAERVLETGTAARHEAQIVDLVRLFPGRDAQELASLSRLNGYHLSNVQIHRRSGGLVKKGLVELDKSGRRVLWYSGARSHSDQGRARLARGLGGERCEDLRVRSGLL